MREKRDLEEEEETLKSSSYDDPIELPVPQSRAGSRSIDGGDRVTRITRRLNLAVIIYLGGRSPSLPSSTEQSRDTTRREDEGDEGGGEKTMTGDAIPPRYGRANGRF